MLLKDEFCHRSQYVPAEYLYIERMQQVTNLILHKTQFRQQNNESLQSLLHNVKQVEPMTEHGNSASGVDAGPIARLDSAAVDPERSSALNEPAHVRHSNIAHYAARPVL